MTGKTPIFDPRLPRKSHWGPFPTIDAFHRDLWLGQDIQDYGEEQLAKFPGLREVAEFHHGRDWPMPTFTHGDLSGLNVIVCGDEVDKFITSDLRALEMEIVRRRYYGDL